MKNKRAFTLIELLIVIAIIGILASLIVLSLGDTRGEAQESKVKTELAQFKKLVEAEELRTRSYSTVLSNLFGEGGEYQGKVDSYESTEDGFCLQCTANSNAYCIDLDNTVALGSCESSGSCDFEEVAEEDCSGMSVGDSCGGGVIAGEVGDDILIAASSDNSVGAEWGCYGTLLGAGGETDGSVNTATIIGSCSEDGIAARLCSEYNEGGYTDWYLPAEDELDLLFANKDIITGFTNNKYWSSTERSSSVGLYVRFSDGADFTWWKDSSYYVRCVRRHSE